MSKIYKLVTLFLLVSTALFAQKYTISGVVSDASSGEKLIGANVYVKDTNIGAASDENGKYSFELQKGTYTVVCSYIGYKTVESTVNLTANMELNFEMTVTQFSLSVTVLADKAKERETPVAFSEIDKKDMERTLGSRDIPLVLNVTPSVYATAQGGGAGDARINVRGFNQRNVAIMINGVPVNDMENGWVYWSNWDGIGDATSSIQMQRGLSAVNLATPSIGGTMNVITDPAAHKMGFKLKQEFGNDGFMKTSLFANSGLINNKFAISAGGVRKVGDGLIDKTWIANWAYYFGAAWNINDNNRLEFYALGAPQRHGQNLYKQNAATYDAAYAMDELGYTQTQVDEFVEQGRRYNQNWSPVNSSYTGKQWLGSSEGDRYDSEFINERENFFHKPQINLNWYSNLSKKVSVYATAYYSGGVGGGTGTYGKVYRRDADGNLGDDDYKFYYGRRPWSWDWNETIAVNSADSGTYYVDKKAIWKDNGESIGILRNSRNNQWTVGTIAKALWRVSDPVTITLGVDWRTAEIDHFREVRDLLGGSYYMDNSDQLNPNKKVGLGDKIVYNFTNNVDWLGFFGQAEYSAEKVTFYGTAGYSTIKYKHTNHFRDDGNGNETVLEADAIGGYQIKGGASYRFTEQVSVFANAGYISKVPIFDNVIDDGSATLAEDPQNEKFTTFEAGVNFKTLDGKFTVNGNFYYTDWKDRALSRGVQNEDGTEGIIFLSGMNQTHMGFELEGAYQPIQMLRFDFAGSFGNWTYTDDVNGRYRDYSDPNNPDKEYNYYVKDLKVGDAPQTQFALAATLFPVTGMNFQVSYRYYANYFADWNPFSRTDETDREQVWELPSYGLLDLHFGYYLPFDMGGVRVQVFGHMFNVLDEVYVQDATDMSKYNALKPEADGGVEGVVAHSAQTAEVFLGIPQTWNAGINIEF